MMAARMVRMPETALRAAARAVAAAVLFVTPATPGLAQDPVLVPPLPQLAPVAPVETTIELDRVRGAATPADPPPEAPATAAPPAETEAAGAGLRTIPEEYRPVMVEALAETAGVAEAEEIGAALGQMDLEVLRIIARMSPEQIDALTLLILSQTPGGGALDAAALPGPAEEADARWIGDWFSQPVGATDTDDPTATGQPAQTGPWSLRETRDGKVVIAHTADPLSRLEVETGMMLGHFGRVTRILRLPGSVQVETAGGTILTGPREGAIATAAVAPAATAEPKPEPAATPRPAPRPEPRPEPAPQPVASAPAAAAPQPAAPAPQPPATPPSKAAAGAAGVLIQAGSFSVPGNASAAAGGLSQRGIPALVREPTRNTPFFRLLVGPVARADIRPTLGALADAGFGDAFVLPSPVPLPGNE